MTIKLLSIEDSKEVQLLIKKTFMTAATVICADNLKKGLDELKNNKIDAILLDLGLPDGDGFVLLNKVKAEQKYANIPVVILSAKDSIQDKVMGFHLGADDYVVKPFDPIELRARVESRVKQSQFAKDRESLTQVGNLLIDYEEHVVTIIAKGQPESVQLTNTEFKILGYFIKHKDHVIEREQLISSTWKYGCHISDRTIDSHISRIRKKIAKSDYSIFAVQNVGYKFVNQNESS